MFFHALIALLCFLSTAGMVIHAIYLLRLLRTDRHRLRKFLINLALVLATMVWEVLWLCVINFARLPSSVLYIPVFMLLIGPFWLFYHPYARLYTRSPTPTTSTKCENGYGPGWNGIPGNWVRVPLCNTDEISELELDPGTSMTAIYEGDRDGREWENREGFTVTRQVMEDRVQPWLDALEDRFEPMGRCVCGRKHAEGVKQPEA